jgi:hypothetical protein
VPKGTESDVSEGGGLLGKDVPDLSGLFMGALDAPEEAPPANDVDQPMTSGVLDIRALADAYASELGQRSEPAEAALPSMVNDEASLGLLIAPAEPEPATQQLNYVVLAVAALFLILGTAAATAFVVDRMAKPAVAAAPTPEQCAQLAQAPAVAQPAAPVLAAFAPAAVSPATAEPTQPAAASAVVPAAVSEPKTKKATETDEEREARAERRRLRHERRAAEAAAREAEEAAKPAVAETAVVESPAPSSEPEPEAKPAATTDKCDEVACLVDPSKACCAKRGPVVKKEEPKEDLPERLTASDVNSGLRPRRGRIDSCGDRHGFQGTATLKLTIAPAGKVGSASVDKGNAAFKSCVIGHVKKASFKKTQKGMTLGYPLVFR